MVETLTEKPRVSFSMRPAEAKELVETGQCTLQRRTLRNAAILPDMIWGYILPDPFLSLWFREGLQVVVSTPEDNYAVVQITGVEKIGKKGIMNLRVTHVRDIPDLVTEYPLLGQ